MLTANEVETLIEELKLVDGGEMDIDLDSRIQTPRDNRSVFVRERAAQAEHLENLLREHMEVVYRFLRAARRSSAEKFIAPDGEAALLRSLDVIRGVLEAIEDMVTRSTDRGRDDNEY
ncbi:hypothetical protein C8R46DRAFT_1026891 [Mycena filopes]|nr:hypothetical protein C8R46DRAFT_1026891 [Mycena filopes]